MAFSLKKILEEIKVQKPITLFVDGSGTGIKKDDKNVFVVDSKMCSMQANYFRSSVYPKTGMPKYIERDLRIFYPDHDLDELIKNVHENAEGAQILGLICLVEGFLSYAKKEKKNAPIYLEHPEVHLHPNRQSKLADFFIEMYTKYA